MDGLLFPCCPSFPNTDVSVDPPTPRLDERGQAEFLLTVAEQQRHGGPAVLPLTAQIVVQCEPIDGASPPLPVVSPPIVVVEEASSGETKWEPDAVVTNCRLFEVGSKSVVLLESIGVCLCVPPYSLLL
jgi:hypothetical protein